MPQLVRSVVFLEAYVPPPPEASGSLTDVRDTATGTGVVDSGVSEVVYVGAQPATSAGNQFGVTQQTLTVTATCTVGNYLIGGVYDGGLASDPLISGGPVTSWALIVETTPFSTNYAGISMWGAEATGTSGLVTFDWDGSGSGTTAMDGVVFEFSNVDLADPIGNTAQYVNVANTASGTPLTQTIATTTSGSGLFVIFNDWNAVDIATNVFTFPTINGFTPTESDVVAFRRNASIASAWAVFYPDVGIAGSKTFGLTVTGSIFRPSMLAIEVRPAGIATDNFNRADSGTLGANWTAAAGNWQIVSNKAQVVSGVETISYWSGFTFDDDQYCEADFTLSAGELGPMVRVDSGTSGYLVDWHGAAGGTLQFYKRTGTATFSSLAVAATGVGTSGTKRLRLEVSGTTLSLYENGVFVASTTDATHTAGAPGMWGFHPSGLAENFQGGSL